ncbi:unnamed protein product [Diplocarpon coronariae]
MTCPRHPQPMQTPQQTPATPAATEQQQANLLEGRDAVLRRCCSSMRAQDSLVLSLPAYVARRAEAPLRIFIVTAAGVHLCQLPLDLGRAVGSLAVCPCVLALVSSVPPSPSDVLIERIGREGGLMDELDQLAEPSRAGLREESTVDMRGGLLCQRSESGRRTADNGQRTTGGRRQAAGGRREAGGGRREAASAVGSSTCDVQQNQSGRAWRLGEGRRRLARGAVTLGVGGSVWLGAMEVDHGCRHARLGPGLGPQEDASAVEDEGPSDRRAGVEIRSAMLRCSGRRRRSGAEDGVGHPADPGRERATQATAEAKPEPEPASAPAPGPAPEPEPEPEPPSIRNSPTKTQRQRPEQERRSPSPAPTAKKRKDKPGWTVGTF